MTLFLQDVPSWINFAKSSVHYRGEHRLRVTGDGLLRLVRLIRTGLVDEGPQDWERSDWMNTYYWEPALTSTGRKLAEAFLNGDAKTFRELLSGQHEPETHGS